MAEPEQLLARRPRGAWGPRPRAAELARSVALRFPSPAAAGEAEVVEVVEVVVLTDVALVVSVRTVDARAENLDNK